MAAAATASKDQQTFEPFFELTQGEEYDTLLLYLPGFKKEQVKVQLSKYVTLRITGRRSLDSDGVRWKSFRKEFTVSSNCDTNKITVEFEGGILFIRQLKLIVPVATAADPKDDENKPATPQTTPPPPQTLTPPAEKTTANGDESDEEKTQENGTKSTVEGEKDDDQRGDGVKSDLQSVVATKLDEYYMARWVTMVVVVVLVAVAVGVFV